MGYEVYITRADDWTDNGGHEIRFEEWERLVNEDPELEIDYSDRLTEQEWERLVAETPEFSGCRTEHGLVFTQEQDKLLRKRAKRLKEGEKPNIDEPGFCDTADWKGHPLGEQRCFWFDEGNIETKDPDLATMAKMLELAEKLAARMQGDDKRSTGSPIEDGNVTIQIGRIEDGSLSRFIIGGDRAGER